MIRPFQISLFLFFLLSSNAFGSFYSSQYSRDSSNIVASVQIKDKGIYNLIISVNFLRRPRDQKIYKSDEYVELLDRLQVEWQGIALQKVLESKEIQVTDLINLRNSIQTEISALAKRLKEKLVPKKEVEVVFSISDFFLLEPRDK